MAHTFSNLLYHIVWSTKDREPLLKKEIKPRIYSYMRTIRNKEGANLLFN
ncbi:MAG: transposase [Parachlamydiaceae bacterium]|nr:transposase [Parachlamydiaceae bacterium]